MQNLFNFRSLLLIVFSMGVFIWSCSKDTTSDTDVNLETQSLPGDGNGGRGPGTWTTVYDCDKIIHKDMAKVISKYFESQNVRQAFDQFRKVKDNEVVLLADFVYNKVLNDGALTSSLGSTLSTVGNSNLCDFVNVYLTQYPGIEISFLIDVDADYPDIINIAGIETVSIYTNCTNYPIYKNGQNTTSFYTGDDSPTDKVILRLQASGVYEVYKMSSSSSASQTISSTLITQTNASNKFSDLLRCDHVASYVNNISNVSTSTKTVNGCVVTNPLTNVKIVVVDNIYKEWNKECSGSDGFPTNTNPGGGLDTLIEFRGNDNCDRDVMRNGHETIRDVRCTNKAILRDCRKWCKYLDERCSFQVDVFIPSVPVGPQFQALEKRQYIFSFNEKRLRRGWFNKEEYPMFKWLYLEERHGDEIQYTWTGRHPKRGTTVKRSFGLSLSSTIGFIVKKVKVELTRKADLKAEVIIAFEDCPLGIVVSTYCAALEEQIYMDDLRFKVTEK